MALAFFQAQPDGLSPSNFVFSTLDTDKQADVKEKAYKTSHLDA